jgi:hypothetical protein
MKFPYFEIPSLQDSDAVCQFDRIVFSCNPSIRAFVRRGIPVEYPPGEFDKMCPPGRQLLKLILQTKGPHGTSLIYVRPAAEQPKEFCSALEDYPVEMSQLIHAATGGDCENN